MGSKSIYTYNFDRMILAIRIAGLQNLNQNATQSFNVFITTHYIQQATRKHYITYLTILNTLVYHDNC